MLNDNLGLLYGLETIAFKQALNISIEKFRFQLTEAEFKNLRSQLVTSNLAMQNPTPAYINLSLRYNKFSVGNWVHFLLFIFSKKLYKILINGLGFHKINCVRIVN